MESDIPYEILVPYEVPVPVPVHDPDLIAEIERLRAELAAHVNENEALGKQQGEFIETIVKLEKQRDEARQLFCRHFAYQMSRLTGVFDPKEVAVKNGWDCFAEEKPDA
jgi:hypothetical protein